MFAQWILHSSTEKLHTQVFGRDQHAQCSRFATSDRKSHHPAKPECPVLRITVSLSSKNGKFSLQNYKMHHLAKLESLYSSKYQLTLQYISLLFKIPVYSSKYQFTFQYTSLLFNIPVYSSTYKPRHPAKMETIECSKYLKQS